MKIDTIYWFKKKSKYNVPNLLISSCDLVGLFVDLSDLSIDVDNLIGIIHKQNS